MVQPGSVIGKITEELGELGKKVGTETAKAPKDIAGKALESLGTASGKKTQGTGTTPTPTTPSEKTPLDKLDETQDEKIKRTMARAALRHLAGQKPKSREPSVWEKAQREAEQKKELAAQQAAAAARAQLPKITPKPRRGNLYGLTKQKAGSETSRNVRSD